MGNQSPETSALGGGLIADRLAWVFIAGYQAALRAIFDDLPGTGWAAYAATEYPGEPADKPGTHIEETSGEWRLHGHKFWVAQSQHVSHLIVTARRNSERPVASVLVDRHMAEVTVTHRERPGFLPDLSQGFAAFDGAVTAIPKAYPEERARQFGHTESRYVMLAAAGFMLSHSNDAGMQDRLAAVALALAQAGRTNARAARAMGAIDREFQRCVSEFSNGNQAPQTPAWQSDQKLLTMYTARIQRRAGQG